MNEENKITWEEIISRIEQAPKEMQTMVAKAFIREDIPNENVQYLFNTDTIEQLNDSAENSAVEHVNAEDVEGIGAVGFTMRTSKPSGNKNFITTGSGGWNTCIKGYPMDANANVLANCVGYASGRFNEIINIARDILLLFLKGVVILTYQDIFNDYKKYNLPNKYWNDDYKKNK